jgi:hypothetical protein
MAGHGQANGVFQQRNTGKVKKAKQPRNITQCSRSVYLGRVVSSYLVREKSMSGHFYCSNVFQLNFLIKREANFNKEKL